MSHFTSITQYDKKYTTTKQKNMCSLFSLITAYNFLNKHDTSSDIHEQNIDMAVTNFDLIGLGSEIEFDNLLSFSNADKKDIMATTTDLVKSNEIGFNIMFPDDKKDKNYSVIFLKNSKFFTVNKSAANKYCIRDCHEMDQYDFNNKEEIIGHLIKTYQFDSKIVIDGFGIDQFSNIEFIIIDTPFDIYLPIIIESTKADTKPNIIIESEKPNIKPDIIIEKVKDLLSLSIIKTNDNTKKYQDNTGEYDVTEMLVAYED